VPELRPAFTRDSAAVRLPVGMTLDELTPDWAWGGASGRGVRVAIVDSGIDHAHPSLEGAVAVDDGVTLRLDGSGDVLEERGAHDDEFGHGTACAGIVHALAPEARITSVKVFGPGTVSRAAVFLRGLAWAVDRRFDVINLSLGTTVRDWALPFHEVCDEAYFHGCLVVTAANNSIRPSFPSLYASVTSVACNLTTDPMRFHFNPDPPTEFLARGIDVDVLWSGGERIRATGNSYAAPHIAGIAGLIRSKHPELRPFQVKTVLWATAANIREAPRAAGRLTADRRAAMSVRATAALRPPFGASIGRLEERP
jgi:subtilisin